jgi:hypothetical protein
MKLVFYTQILVCIIFQNKNIRSFNTDFGNELYLVEERPSDSKRFKTFGEPDIISTEDLLENLHKDEKYAVDEDEYIKARLFDMLIGTGTDMTNGVGLNKKKSSYLQIPRDRDQAFSKFDGALLSILMTIPALRHMQTFKDDIKNIKWFNREPYP